MRKIPIGVRGTVRNGEHPSMRVRIEAEVEATGGYFIYQWWDGSDGPNEDGAFDDYVESADALRQYFAETGWIVDWHDPKNDETHAA